MKKHLTLILLLHLAYPGSAQEHAPTANTSVQSLKKNLYYLASDELNGRKTGSEGQKKATAYIARCFTKYGLTPIGMASASPYLQPFSLCKAAAEEHLQVSATIKSTSTKVLLLNDIMVLSAKGFGDTEVTPYIEPMATADGKSGYVPVVEAPTIYEGFAKIEQACKGEVAGTFMLVVPSKHLFELRKSRSALSTLHFLRSNESGDTIFTSLLGRSFPAKGNEYYSRILPYLAKHPSLNIILTDDIFTTKLFKSKGQEAGSGNEELRVGETIAFKGSTSPDKLITISTENVVGLIEGTDKKDEAVILCAHYDHIDIRSSLGKRMKNDTIYNGADDNASGTAAIMEVARLLAKAKRDGYPPRRTIVVAAFTAEEMGLIGSSYMAENPIVPLSKTRMVVNIDMVGRTNGNHTDTSMYVYPLLQGSTDSTLTHTLNQNAKLAGIDINSKLANGDLMSGTLRSDQVSFVKTGIPAISLTTGKHPDFHRPSDEADRISYPRLTRITNFAFYTVWKLANE